MRDIDIANVDDFVDYNQRLEDVLTSVHRLLDDCKDIIQLQTLANKFLTLVENHRRTVLHEIAMLLPKVRSGEEPTRKLALVMEKTWNTRTLSLWVRRRRQDLTHIRIWAEEFEKVGGTFVPDREMIDEHLARRKEAVLMIKLPTGRGARFLEILEQGKLPADIENNGTQLSSDDEDFSETEGKLQSLKAFLVRNQAVLQGAGRVFVTSTKLLTVEASVHPVGKKAEPFHLPKAPELISAEASNGIHSIVLKWAMESPHVQVESFQIEYQEATSPNWDSASVVLQPATSHAAQVQNLKSGTEYAFRVWTGTALGLSAQPSEIKNASTASATRCAIFMRDWYSQKAKKNDEQRFPGEICELKKTELYPRGSAPSNMKLVSSYGVGPTQPQFSPQRVVLVVGETGTGKTTLLDGIANAFYKVQFEDPFRFKLINENVDPDMAARKQNAESVTKNVTIYTLNPVLEEGAMASAADFPLVLIDTPGFGDTAGLEKDQETVTEISDMLCGNSVAPGLAGLLHGICFVVKASQTRLTAAQQYVFQQVLSLFGSDMEAVFLNIITFAGTGEPQVLKSLRKEGIPGQVFPVDNDMLFADNRPLSDVLSGKAPIDEEEELELELNLGQTKSQWQKATLTYRKFFNALKKSSTGITLEKTKTVLTKRRQLENAAISARARIDEGLIKLQKVQECIAFIKSVSKTITHAELNMRKKVTEPKTVKIDLQQGEYVTLCLQCNFTCHYPCFIPRDEDKYGCAAMQNGHCVNCSKRCHWNVHVNASYRIDIQQVEKEITVEALCRQYQVDVSQRDSKVQLIGKMVEDYHRIRLSLANDLATIHSCLKTLEETALRSYPFSVMEYIDLMVKTLEDKKGPGWADKVASLRDARRYAEIISSLKDGADIYARVDAMFDEADIGPAAIQKLVEDLEDEEQQEARGGSLETVKNTLYDWSAKLFGRSAQKLGK